MKLHKKLLITTLSLSLFSLGYAKDGYFVILKSFQQPSLKQAQAIDKQFTQLEKQGFSPFFIKTNDYPPLKKGLWAMVLGEFDKTTADNKQAKVNKWVGDAYVRKVTPPKLKPMADGFVYAETSIDENKCFVINEEGDNEDWHKEVSCVGIQGHSVKIDYRAALTDFYLDNHKLTIDIDFSEDLSTFPLVWIYQKARPQNVLAFSFVLSGDGTSKRYVFVRKDNRFIKIEKTFPIKALDEIADYLHNNYGEKLDTEAPKNEDTTPHNLQACLDDNHSSGWHRIANENSCYIQDYQRQIINIHQQIDKAYQELLTLPMHKDKQATGSLKKMHGAWQQYRDNKCQLFQALASPFRRAQQSNCERETMKNYLEEQQKLLQEIKGTLADDKSFSKND